MNHKLTAQQAAAIADHIRDRYGDDEDLILGMVEGETDAGEYLDNILEYNATDALLIDAMKAMESQVSARRKRVERRVEARRAAMQAIMEAVGVKKWERPLATLSLGERKPKRIVSGPDALPDEYCRFKREPDMSKIKDADDLPPGVTMDNGGVTLTVRTS